MLRLLLVAGLGLAAIAGLRAATAATAVPAPAAAGAMGSSLVLAPDGTPWLSWLEPAGPEAWAMKVSRFAPDTQTWSAPRTVVQDADLMTNWADFPQLSVARDGRLTAVWFVNNPAHHAAAGDGHHGPGYRAIYRSSADGGTTWSPDLPVSDESLAVEFVALQPLADGRMLAAWLDGRNHGRMALYARVLDGRPGPGPDTLVDDSVCDCCQLSFVPATGGGALLAYRGRTKDEIRDIQLARFGGRDWRRLGPLHADAWKIAGCPVNGPQLAVAGDRVGAVWFTAAHNQSRVLARVSADGGKTFGTVARVDLGRPQGRVDSVLLADGTLVLSWLEMTGQESGKAGGIYFRTLSPAGELSAPQLVASTSTSRMSGFPRMVLLGGRRVLLTCTQEGEPTRVLTLLVDVD
ncbi:MAG TPA: sialidase family protein [Lacunisphaera sp.]